MWANSNGCRVALAALAVLWLTAACGKTNTTESGETHFVMCDTDADCSSVSGAHSCQGGLCRAPSGAPGGGSTSAPAATSACDGECGNSECATPGSCTLAAACKVVDCGSALVDDNACVRPGCQSDADCPDDERCASVYLSRHYQCVQNGNSCACQAGLGLFPLTICSPVGKAGARGQWQSLTIDESVIGDMTQHAFVTDGQRDGQARSGSPGRCLDHDQAAERRGSRPLQMLLNGTELRRDLADPKECPLTKEYDALVGLQLDGTLLEKNVAGCLSNTGGVASFQQLMDLVRKY